MKFESFKITTRTRQRNPSNKTNHHNYAGETRSRYLSLLCGIQSIDHIYAEKNIFAKCHQFLFFDENSLSLEYISANFAVQIIILQYISGLLTKSQNICNSLSYIVSQKKTQFFRSHPSLYCAIVLVWLFLMSKNELFFMPIWIIYWRFAHISYCLKQQMEAMNQILWIIFCLFLLFLMY